MVNKSDIDSGIETPKYIVIATSWRDHLLFTISDGMKYLELQSYAIRIEGEIANDNRKEGLKISSNSKPVEISYMTETRFKQLRMETIVDPPPETPT